MLCFADGQTGRQADPALVILVCVLHLTLHVRLLSQVRHVALPENSNALHPHTVLSLNANCHNLSFLFCLGEYTTTGNMLRPLIYSKTRAWNAQWRDPDSKVAFQT